MGRILRVLGVDPGLASATAAVFGYDGPAVGAPRLLGILDIPTKGEDAAKRIDVLEFQRWIGQHDPDVAYIENATAMPAIPDQFGVRRGMGAGTMARYMRATGAIEATVALCGVDIVLTMPGQWKKKLGLTGPDKGKSLDLIRATFPDVADKWFKRKRDHNRAEAALLALYGSLRTDMIEIKGL
jgi:crossover junction endodeoxyribonuclease RuvC